MARQKFSFPVLILSVIIISCGKKDTPPAPVVPVIMIDNAALTRTTSTGTMHFTISLNKTTSVPVTVDYLLVDGTALAPRDYTAASGTITVPANQTSAALDVAIKGDPADIRQTNLQFAVQLSNAKNGALGVLSGTGTIITEDGTNFVTDNTGYSTPATYPGYTLAWSDEFSGSSLNLGIWNQETGNNGGWGNNELEYYTNSSKNYLVSNGNLVIEARKEDIGSQHYSSGRMTTQGKKSFTFGRIDIRAKLPVAKGMWPALWMLGSNIGSVPWPGCGETDIMELIGTNPSRVYGTAHWKRLDGAHDSKGSQFDLAGANFSQQFHVFSLLWTTDQMKWLIDDQLYLTVVKADVGTSNYPFNLPSFMIFNVAVGGDWPGPPDASTIFPQRMIVDYVRVFQ